MRRAAQAFVVTVLVIVAGIVLREQGPPFDGGRLRWQSRSGLLAAADTLLGSAGDYSVVRARSGQPLLLDRRDGSVHALPGTRLLALAPSGAAVSETDGRIIGSDAAGRRRWTITAEQLVGTREPAPLGSTGSVVAVSGCPADRGTTVGLDIRTGSRRWRLAGPCALTQPESTPAVQYFATLRGTEVQVRRLADAGRVAVVPRVRGVSALGDVLLVLDTHHQLSARTAGRVRWQLDPETAALTEAPATALEPAYAGMPAVVFPGGIRALVDAGTGTLRRARSWGHGPLRRGDRAGAAADGREFAWIGDRLVVRNVFTGLLAWHVDLPAGSATAGLADPDVVTVSLERDNGRHQVFAYDAATGTRLLRSRPTAAAWHLLPVGAGEVLATSAGRAYLFDVG